MRTFHFLVLSLLLCGVVVAGHNSHGGADECNDKTKEKQTASAGDKEKDEAGTISRLMEMLTEVQVDFDPITITPDEVKRLVKEHKVISRYADLKRKSTKKEDATSANKRQNKPVKGHPKRGNTRSNDKKKLPKRRPLLKTGRVDYSDIEDPVKRGLLERIYPRRIPTYAEEMSIEQLQQLEQTVHGGSTHSEL
jgi:hypothetical protein